jgi:hypothetical protein
MSLETCAAAVCGGDGCGAVLGHSNSFSGLARVLQSDAAAPGWLQPQLKE